ncbi:MAG: glycerophosphodiester phosphodiesterase family protein, partial [Sediminibacterium sp.]|nr:glycerophosphodiester phosphodiesterase family protein [Sediminibacterium sp.]
SFDIRSLQYLHKKYPSIKTAVLIEDFDKKSFTNQIEALGFTPTIYSPHYSLVTQELIEACHIKGIQVIPWTVNDLPTIQRLKKMGVDGIISDFPNLFADL